MRKKQKLAALKEQKKQEQKPGEEVFAILA